MPADTTTDILGLFPPGSAVDPDGELVVGGCRLADLAARWGTPMYVVDEQAVRSQVRRYRQALAAAWPHGTHGLGTFAARLVSYGWPDR